MGNRMILSQNGATLRGINRALGESHGIEASGLIRLVVAPIQQTLLFE